MRLLKDEEVKRLATEEVLDKVLKHYEETDVWHFCRANEVHVKGINNLPLFYMSYAGKITATCPVDVFEENIKESGLFIEIPDSFDEKLTYAIREIGLESAYDRAGLSCRLMRTIEDTGLVRALDAEQRGILLDTGFAQSSEEIKILVSDEKISTVGSSKYAILDYRTGLNNAKESILLQPDFDGITFSNGAISHEGLVVAFNISGAGVDSHRLMLERAVNGTIDYQFIWSSSHTKMSSMIGRLAVNVNGVTIPVGKSVKIRHMGQAEALMDQFRKSVGRLGASLKENEDQIERLGNTPIYFPKTCLKNALDTCSSISAAAKKAAVDSMPDVACTAMDVYLKVNEAAMSVKGVSALVAAMEEAAQLQAMNFKVFEKEKL